MSRQELTALGHILMRGGSNNAYIILNTHDVELLGLKDNKDNLEITEVPARMQGYLQADMPDTKPKTVKRLAVEPITSYTEGDPENQEAVIRSYNVNVGVAWKAFEKVYGSKRPDGCRQRDPAAKPPEPEPANA